ncbi:MAG: hypothetical protein HKN89_08295 [Eudoraea sp.]|nr:hypothetical protein [Eudoraea sp.]
MNYHGFLSSLPRGIRLFLSAFLILLSIGFYTGLLFVSQTESISPQGVVENYLGNEDEAQAAVMKFKKSDREMLNIIHTHILSMSFIFLLLGVLVWGTSISDPLKRFLTIEPFVSVLLTFGGIYLMWRGILWMKYIIILSGTIMTITFISASLIVFYQLHFSIKK